MIYLIDTHVLIWAITETKQLSESVRKILENPSNKIMVSPLCFWEISLKYSLKKLEIFDVLPENFPKACEELGFSILPFTPEIASSFHYLNAIYHRDPFDRMLIHTAIQLDIPIISKDENFKFYASEGLKVIW